MGQGAGAQMRKFRRKLETHYNRPPGNGPATTAMRTRRSQRTRSSGDSRGATLFEEVQDLARRCRHGVKLSKSDYYKDFGEGFNTWDVDALQDDISILRRRAPDNDGEENDETRAPENAPPRRSKRATRSSTRTSTRAASTSKKSSAATKKSATASTTGRSRRAATKPSAAAPKRKVAKRSSTAASSTAGPGAFGLQDALSAMLNGGASTSTAPHTRSPPKRKTTTTRSKGRKKAVKEVISLTESSEEELEDERDANLDLSRLGNMDPEVTDTFEFLKQLGDEGKDGITFLCRARTAAKVDGVVIRKKGSLAALKIFKPQKSVNLIRAEYDLLARAADAGVAPPIVSTWNIDARHRCFAMQALDRTFLQLIRAQNGRLSAKQQKQILHLFDHLGKNVGLFHNDGNVARNIMIDDSTGKMYLIDFGMAVEIDRKLVKRFGPNPNFSLLCRVDRYVQETNKKQGPYFAKIIRKYELDNNVVVDLHAQQRRHQEEAMQRAIERIRSR